MIDSDLAFNYSNINRFILLHKLLISNSFIIPKAEKIICYFSLKDLDDLNDVKIYNYFYFFRFFLGIKAFFTGYNRVQGFGKTTYDFRVQIVLRKSDLYNFFSFFLNDVISVIDHEYLNFNISNLNYFVCNLSIKDMNIFSEKKTNLGLFNLKDNLHMDIFINCLNNSFLRLFLLCFKFYFIR